MCEECERLRLDALVAWLCRDWSEMWRLIRLKERHEQTHAMWQELWPGAMVCTQNSEISHELDE